MRKRERKIPSLIDKSDHRTVCVRERKISKTGVLEREREKREERRGREREGEKRVIANTHL